MLKYKKIKVGKKSIEAFFLPLQTKNLILLRGSRGYIMCGYLNLKAADKFKDAAVKVTGVSSINDVISACAYSCSSSARKLGIYKGQPIKEVLKIIA